MSTSNAVKKTIILDRVEEKRKTTAGNKMDGYNYSNKERAIKKSEDPPEYRMFWQNTIHKVARSRNYLHGV